MRRFLLPGLLGIALSAPAQAGAAAQAADPCPGATAWAQTHPEESDEAMARRDAARSFSDPQLRAELATRVEKDQKIRIASMKRPSDQRLRHAWKIVDEDNASWLVELVQSKGFPTAAQVGEQGVNHAWLLLHHVQALQFQAALLPALRQRAMDGELRRSDFARFADRILKAHDKPQHYGTQFSPQEWARVHFGLPDEASVREVDANRRLLGVMPLADYVCFMSEARKPQRRARDGTSG